MARFSDEVRALLSKNGIEVLYADVFGKRALGMLADLQLRPAYRRELDGYLALAACLGSLLRLVDRGIEAMAKGDPRAMLLCAIPGIGYYSALLILCEIGDIARLATARKLCAYAGLALRVHSSGGRTRHGPITKQGSRRLRWIMVERSQDFVAGSRRMRGLYERVRSRHGANAARVAAAGEMLKVIFYMLGDRRPFYGDLRPAVSSRGPAYPSW